MKKCACCNAMSGKDEWSGRLCDDCKQHTEVASEFEWYRMMIHLRRMALIFMWTYPMLFVSPWLLTGRVAIEWWCWPLGITAWVFTFISYRKRNWPKRMAEQREKLWLLKISN